MLLTPPLDIYTDSQGTVVLKTDCNFKAPNLDALADTVTKLSNELNEIKLKIEILNSLSSRVAALEAKPGVSYVILDKDTPYITAEHNTVYVAETSCTFTTIRIPEAKDLFLGFYFKVIDYGAGGFQIVQSDGQQILAAGISSTIGVKGGLKSLSRFGSAAIILAEKGAVDTFVIDGELPSNMTIF